ncbi:hypothetical protein, partial [Rhizobium sp. UBA1881]|uniref:hypothetical protein n=1 Tax=Rhizobium sp. UBA1881 TaxID=1947375 RepID=UPI0025DD11D3
ERAPGNLRCAQGHTAFAPSPPEQFARKPVGGVASGVKIMPGKRGARHENVTRLCHAFRLYCSFITRVPNDILSNSRAPFAKRLPSPDHSRIDGGKGRRNGQTVAAAPAY